MLIITDIDGTLADDRYRKDLYLTDPIKFYMKMVKDPVNPHGMELLNKIRSVSKDPVKLVIISSRPRSYTAPNGKKINVAMKTRKWLLVKKIKCTRSLSRRKKYEDPIEGKLQPFLKTILKFIYEKEMYYLEDDPVLAQEAKRRCPMVRVFLVSYEGYEEILEE